MAFTAQEHREYRFKLRKQGRCTECGKATNGKMLCDTCLISRIGKRNAYRKSHVSIGLCQCCYEPISPKSHKYCENHRIMENKYTKTRRKRYVLSGRCCRCGREVDEFTAKFTTTCQECNEQKYWHKLINGR